MYHALSGLNSFGRRDPRDARDMPERSRSPVKADVAEEVREEIVPDPLDAGVVVDACAFRGPPFEIARGCQRNLEVRIALLRQRAYGLGDIANLVSGAL